MKHQGRLITARLVFIVVAFILGGHLSGCSARDVKQVVYESGARHQCRQNADDSASSARHLECNHETRVDGRDFDEYEDERKKLYEENPFETK